MGGEDPSPGHAAATQRPRSGHTRRTQTLVQRICGQGTRTREVCHLSAGSPGVPGGATTTTTRFYGVFVARKETPPPGPACRPPLPRTRDHTAAFWLPSGRFPCAGRFRTNGNVPRGLLSPAPPLTPRFARVAAPLSLPGFLPLSEVPLPGPAASCLSALRGRTGSGLPCAAHGGDAPARTPARPALGLRLLRVSRAP